MFSQKLYLLLLNGVLIFMIISHLADPFRAVFHLFSVGCFVFFSFLLAANVEVEN